MPERQEQTGLPALPPARRACSKGHEGKNMTDARFREGKQSMRKSAIAVMAGLAGLGLATVAATAGVVKDDGLKPYEIVGDIAIPKPLTDKPGDPARGRKLIANRKKGNCLACHKIDQMKDYPFHGEIGPDLSDLASNMPAEEIRLRLVNPKVINPDTIMPAFYRVEGLYRVMKKFRGKPILTAQEIEDIISYLVTLKKPEKK